MNISYFRNVTPRAEKTFYTPDGVDSKQKPDVRLPVSYNANLLIEGLLQWCRWTINYKHVNQLENSIGNLHC